MAAGPIGACWKTGSWSDTAWTANTWADQPIFPATLLDLTTIFIPYVQSLRDSANLAAMDSDTLIAHDLPTVLAAAASDDDHNTAYAVYLS